MEDWMKITIELSTGKKIELTDSEYFELSGVLRAPLQIQTYPIGDFGIKYIPVKATPIRYGTYDLF
jgi:hypothetical protein